MYTLTTGGTQPTQRRHGRAGLRHIDDDALLARARDGHQEAFAELYARHFADARRYARRVAHPSEYSDAADEIVAEAFRKILSAIRGGRGPVTGFRSYLFTSVRSVASSRRKLRRHETTVEYLPDWQTIGSTEDQLDAFVAMTAFGTLPDRWQRTLWATKVQQMTPTEIEPLLQLGGNAIAALSIRARDALRVAYVRAHLPPAHRAVCRVPLDTMARQAVEPIGGRQRRLLDAHVADCRRCARAAVLLDSELANWARHRTTTAFLAPAAPAALNVA